MNAKQWLLLVAVAGSVAAGGAGIALAVMNAKEQVDAAATPPRPPQQ